MKKLKASQILQNTGEKIFTFADIKKLLKIEKDNTAYKQVEGLIDENVLCRAKRGIYYLSSNPPTNFHLANIIYQPSYVSLESALSYYNILIQVPTVITSVTTKTAKSFKIGGKEYTYTHLSPQYFAHYHREADFLIAAPEKALVDAIFYASLGKGSVNLEELELEDVDKGKLKEIAGEIKHTAFRKYFKRLSL